MKNQKQTTTTRNTEDVILLKLYKAIEILKLNEPLHITYIGFLTPDVREQLIDRAKNYIETLELNCDYILHTPKSDIQQIESCPMENNVDAVKFLFNKNLKSIHYSKGNVKPEPAKIQALDYILGQQVPSAMRSAGLLPQRFAAQS